MSERSYTLTAEVPDVMQGPTEFRIWCGLSAVLVSVTDGHRLATGPWAIFETPQPGYAPVRVKGEPEFETLEHAAFAAGQLVEQREEHRILWAQARQWAP